MKDHFVVRYPRARDHEAAETLGQYISASFPGAKVEMRLGEGEMHVERHLPPTRGFKLLTVAEAQLLCDVQRGAYLAFKLLTPTAKPLTRGSFHAAGLDICYDGTEDLIFLPGDRRLVSTGIAIAVPAGHYARVAPRSGLSVKGFDVGAGVVDADYRGEVRVLLSLHESAEEPFTFEPGDRIAQIVIEKCSLAPAVQVDDLPDTARGSGGFGSTGR